GPQDAAGRRLAPRDCKDCSVWNYARCARSIQAPAGANRGAGSGDHWPAALSGWWRMTAQETQDGLAAARVPSSARPDVRAGLCVAQAEATRSGRGAGRNLGAPRDTADARAVAVAGSGNCGAGGRSILVYVPGLAS